MATMPSQAKSFELFLGCRGFDAREHENSGSFAVLLLQTEEAGQFKEISRTETVCNSSAFQYCTSFELCLAEHNADQACIRFDFYYRKTEESERLRDHQLFGKATIPIDNVLSSDGNHLAVQISHPTEAQKVGVAMISAEEIDVSNPENETEIQFDVSAAVLRKKDWNKTFLGQRYELCRAHKHDDCDGHTVWLPICRSNRISKQRNSNTEVEFSSVALRYRHVCNGDDERRMKLSMYASSGPKKCSGEMFLGFVDFTFRDICELDPTEEVLQLEGSNAADSELGTASILRAEPTDFGSHFALKINYASTLKYSSAVDVEKRPPKKKVKGMARRLSLNIRDRSSSKKDNALSPASTLFTNSFID